MTKCFLQLQGSTMFRRLLAAIAVMHAVVGFVSAAEYDAVFDDISRSAARNLKTPDTFYYGPIQLDSKGKVVTRLGKAGLLTKDTKICMGVFDEKKKKWAPGEVVEGGVEADIFTDAGKTLRVRVTVTDDDKTIKQILVVNTDEKFETADGEFDAIFRGVGRTNVGGRVAFSYVRVELDDSGKAINYFNETISSIDKTTKVSMGKFNAKENEWEAGDDIPNGIYGDIFKDPGAKNIYVRITYRADLSGIAQVLVRRIGEKDKK